MQVAVTLVGHAVRAADGPRPPTPPRNTTTMVVVAVLAPRLAPLAVAGLGADALGRSRGQHPALATRTALDLATQGHARVHLVRVMRALK